MAENDRIFDTALQIRHAREASKAVDDYVGNMRLALQDVQASNVDMVRDLRDEMVELQTKSTEAVLSLAERISELVEVLANVEPIVVNVPETNLTLEAAPVNVTLPKPPATIKPVINVPAPKVVIEKPEKPESKMPKSLRIKHSDGTQSTIEFGK